MERREIVEMNNQPLVSVPVITYNSSKFVLETLESIKAQTYQNIELIISDDCSTDNTVELCQKWVEQNKDRFIRTQIITSETNTGVSANLNRAESICKGIWVKVIDGDDILLPNSIQDLILYVQKNQEIDFIFGKALCFNQHGILKDYLKDFLDDTFWQLSAEEQYDRLVIRGNCLPCPTFFYKRMTMREIGVVNDESIPLCEDYPKWINITKLGYKLFCYNQVIVNYRIHSDSLSQGESQLFRLSAALIYKKYCFHEQFKRNPIVAIFRLLCVNYYITKKNIYKVFIYALKIVNRIFILFNKSCVNNNFKNRFMR